MSATLENVPSDISTQQRLISACASVQPDQKLHCLHEETAFPGIKNVPSENSEQTVLMLI